MLTEVVESWKAFRGRLLRVRLRDGGVVEGRCKFYGRQEIMLITNHGRLRSIYHSCIAEVVVIEEEKQRADK